MKKGTALGLAWNLSWTMLFSLALPLLAGIWIDKKLGTEPLFILTGAVLGILAATLGVARMALRTFSHIAGEDTQQSGPEDGKEEPE